MTFPCGAQVELCFRRLFSNVMYVCAKLQPPPAHVADARVMLCRPTVSPVPPVPTGAGVGGGLWGSEGWKRLNPHRQESSVLPLVQIILPANTSECSSHVRVPRRPPAPCS